MRGSGFVPAPQPNCHTGSTIKAKGKLVCSPCTAHSHHAHTYTPAHTSASSRARGFSLVHAIACQLRSHLLPASPSCHLTSTTCPQGRQLTANVTPCVHAHAGLHWGLAPLLAASAEAQLRACRAPPAAAPPPSPRVSLCGVPAAHDLRNPYSPRLAPGATLASFVPRSRRCASGELPRPAEEREGRHSPRIGRASG